MRTIAVTITLDPPDETFDYMSDAYLAGIIQQALLRRFPYMIGGEVTVSLIRPPMSVERLDDELAMNYGSCCLDDSNDRRRVAEYIHGLLKDLG
jgi:hypothetical protein